MYRWFIFVSILFLLDWYVFQALKIVTKSWPFFLSRTAHITFWSFFVAVSLFTLLGFMNNFEGMNKIIRNYAIAILVIVTVSKLFVVLFLLIDDLIRFGRWIFSWLQTLVNAGGAGKPEISHSMSRIDFLSRLGFMVAAVPFFSLIYGMLGNVYRWQVRKVSLSFDNLPEAFDGLRIVQFSDFHIGSFLSKERVVEAVDLILAQKADIVFFTGDLVNDIAPEAETFFEELKNIKAPMGVYTILGNHDYGDYYPWNSDKEKADNFKNLVQLQKRLGWDLLLNEHRTLEKNSESIGLIGVENWSNHMRFPKHGDLAKAMSGLNDMPFNILLSHDPSHWKAQVTGKAPSIDLTLSGHTHGMQFGIEIPGFRWSPVKYFYPEWADLYNEEKQYLYVNRGLGFIGYPGRVGILPEITVFELKRG